MCYFPIFLCFPECAFSQPSFPNVVYSSLLFPSRSVVADTSFLLAHTSIKRGPFVVDYPRSLPYYTEMCAKIIEWMLKQIQYNLFGGFQPLSMQEKPLFKNMCSVQVCEEAGHSPDLVGKGGRAGNSTWWDEPLSPESVWLGLGAPLLSVFSLHGFVCGLSETFQESHSQLHGGNECQKRVWWLLEHLFNYILNTVKFVLLESVVHFKQQKKRLSFLKLRK